MFISRQTHTRRTHRTCQFCHDRVLIKKVFVQRDGPADHFFCSRVCSLDWSKYRQDPRVAALVKMRKEQRGEIGVTDIRWFIEFMDTMRRNEHFSEFLPE